MQNLCKTEEVIFSDGSKVIVSEENFLIGMRLQEMNAAAIEGPPLKDAKAQIFRQTLYPKMAACSSGDVPTEEQALLMPSKELDKWYNAARRLNPHWFIIFDVLSEQLQADENKKKARKRRKSANG